MHLFIPPSLLLTVLIFIGSSFGDRALAANQLIAHDPVMAKEGDTFYIFTTGPNIPLYSSKDLRNWKNEGSALPTLPVMAKQVAPEFAGHLWAPDIHFHKGQYYLYYSASAFGKNTSGIGVSVNKTLNPRSPDYHWKELGTVIASVPGRDDWNAIDPNIIEDEQGNGWMAFGSFWTGIKMFKLNADWTRPAEPQQWVELAERPRHKFAAPGETKDIGAVEGPFILKKGDYYYLFVSFDLCCKGKDSNYNLRVGRSKQVTGPYLDKDNVDMRKGGGTLVLAGNKDWPGVGHNSAYTIDGKDYLVLHAYDASDKYTPKLKIIDLHWDKDLWPKVDINQFTKSETLVH